MEDSLDGSQAKDLKSENNPGPGRGGHASEQEPQLSSFSACGSVNENGLHRPIYLHA